MTHFSSRLLQFHGTASQQQQQHLLLLVCAKSPINWSNSEKNVTKSVCYSHLDDRDRATIIGRSEQLSARSPACDFAIRH
jgi:hypothetical protein